MVFYEWHWGKHLLWKGLDGIGYFLDKAISSVIGRWVRLTCVKPTSVLTHSSLGPAALYWILPWEVAKTASPLHQIHRANWPGSRIELLQGIQIYPNHTSKHRISHPETSTEQQWMAFHNNLLSLGPQHGAIGPHPFSIRYVYNQLL